MELTLEFTGELPDSEVESAVVAWADSELDDRISTYLSDNDYTTDVEGAIRGLLDDFTPGAHGCATARAFEEAVSGIMDHRGEIVIKQNVDGITGEVRDALADMIAKEVETQVSVMIVNIQRGLRRLHERNPEVAGSI
tara:strand:+ start:862 stop:1275 length:414 start_codon:yes stop_codon:yes gene_type:complete